MTKAKSKNLVYVVGTLLILYVLFGISALTSRAAEDFSDTYPSDSDVEATLTLGTTTKSITKTVKSQEDRHTYRFEVKGKSVRLDVDLSGSGVGSPVTLSPSYAGGVSSDGATVIKLDKEYHYYDTLRCNDIKFNTKRSLYLNEGTYFITVNADHHVAYKGTDGKYYNSYSSEYPNYTAYKYTLNLKMTEVNDIAKGKQNGNLFKDAIDIKVGDKVTGVVPLCSYGSPNMDANLGGKSENYRFVITEKTNVAAIISGYDKSAVFTWIGFYKEGDTPYYADAVKTNQSSVVENTEEPGASTKTHSLSAVLTPGTYFLYMEIHNGLFDSSFDGTPYTVTLKKKTTSIADAAVGLKASYSYTGSAIKPTPSVKLGTKILKNGTDYTVKYTNNVNVGLATVKITGKGLYAGTLTKTFKILPKGTDIVKVTGKKGGFSASWTARKLKMKTSRITGYQIQYSTTKDFSSGNKITSAKGYVLSTKEVKNLPAGTYRVRIRTYMTVGGVNYYSAWSKAVSVKVK